VKKADWIFLATFFILQGIFLFFYIFYLPQLTALAMSFLGFRIFLVGTTIFFAGFDGLLGLSYFASRLG
jgi:hypothetical protein